MKHDEDKLVESCKLYYEYIIPQSEHWRFIHVPNGGRRNIIEATRFKKMGVKSGVPDIMIILKNGYTCWLEFKNPNGKGSLSANQEMYRQNLINNEHEWFKIENFEEFKQVLFTIKSSII